MKPELFRKDYDFGIKAENLLLQKFCDTFGKVEKSTNKSTPYDYEGENLFIELKTRRNTKDKYDTTMIGKNKIDWACDMIRKIPETKVYFCFCFTDGVYYWEYKERNLEDLSFANGGRYDRGRPEIKEYCFIQVNKLICI